MPKHHSHHHLPHERRPGPAGLHQIAGRLQEMREMGATDTDIEAVLTLVKDKLPKNLIATADALNLSDQGSAMAQCAADANAAALASLRATKCLIAGEMRPHIIMEMMREGICLFQVHDATHHGDRPPHFRHLADRYAMQFTGVLSLLEIKDHLVEVVLVDAYVDRCGDALASPLAMMACRLWPQAKVLAVMSDHKAPHHVGRLGREIDQFLYWE